MSQPCIIITGADTAISQELALILAEEGYDLALVCLQSSQSLLTLQDNCLQYGATATIYPCSLEHYDPCQKLLTNVAQNSPTIYGLVNNAGQSQDGLLNTMSEYVFTHIIHANLNSTFNMCKAVAPYLMDQENGSIVNVSSIVGLCGNKGQCNYAAAKAGIIGLTKSLAKELGEHNIRVNAVAPGFIQTTPSFDTPTPQQQTIISRTSLNRFGTPLDVANAISFLLSPQADFITAQVLSVDGDLSM